MDKESREFLNNLLLTPSPTGFEQPVQNVVRSRMKRFADTIETDLHGNVIAGINTKASRRVMLAGHCDQIGFMVKNISAEGYVYLGALGGIDTGVMFGSHITIYSKGGPVSGIVGRKPIHQQSAEERGHAKADLDKLWIDIGAKTKKDAEKMIAIGDPATFRLEVREMGKDLIISPGLDDKVGLFIAMEALRLCAKAKLKVGLYAVSTVQEEVGLRGAKTAAYRIDPEVGIAIDVTHASDSPASDGHKGLACKLGDGPQIPRGPNINPIVEQRLVAAAKKIKIKYQPSVAPGLLGTDANSIQVSKAGVATSSIGVPNRYMHTQVEVCSLTDLENTAKLLAQFVKDIDAKTDFTPR